MPVGHVILLLMEHWYSWILLWVLHAWLLVRNWCGSLVWTIDVFTASLPSCHGNSHNVRWRNGCASKLTVATMFFFQFWSPSARFDAKTWKHGFGKKNATIVTLIFNNYTHCNLEFRHLFVNFGHTGAMHHSKKNKSCWAHVVPGCWRTTYFDMLVNYHFTTAAYTRFWHKLVPGRIGHTLDTHQPEE